MIEFYGEALVGSGVLNIANGRLQFLLVDPVVEIGLLTTSDISPQPVHCRGLSYLSWTELLGKRRVSSLVQRKFLDWSVANSPEQLQPCPISLRRIMHSGSARL